MSGTQGPRVLQIVPLRLYNGRIGMYQLGLRDTPETASDQSTATEP